jgi:hypothetical protein
MDERTNNTPRQLVHVPLIHAPADMGTMAKGLEAVCAERFGRRRWQAQLALVERFWGAVRLGLEGLRVDWAKVNLYQDGLPVCGKEQEIVRAAAGQGSQNHQLLLDLMARGAAIVGTEDVQLLLEEYREVQEALRHPPGRGDAARSPDAARRHAERLALRDVYIALRIGQTLQPGRTAVLLLGMAHAIEGYLPGDIVVSRLHLNV